MPRYKRDWRNFACYHITHRCHERKFLLKFAKYRDLYIKYLFEIQKRFNDLKILNFVVTSNLLEPFLSIKKYSLRKFFEGYKFKS